jgi:signal transduction histidine kinase
MPVDLSDVLHVLAHELRGPSGIAQGYLRMLLEDRLIDSADRRRALEQTQQALARVSELTNESSQLANWFDAQRETKVVGRVDARALIERVAANAGIDPVPTTHIDVAPASASVPTASQDALAAALATCVKATARELKGKPVTIAARVNGNHTLDVLIGSDEQLDVLSQGPDADNAGPISLERGGLGLSLVLAAAVLDAHGAAQWTTNGSRNTVGVRLPLDERPHQ